MARAKMMDSAAETIESAAGEGADTMKTTMEKASKGFEKFTSFHKDMVEAMIASAGAATQGAEKIQGEFAAYAKSTAEEMAEASKAIMGAKSLKAAFELQSAYAKSSLETYMAEMGKMNELWMGVARDAMAPIQAKAKSFMATIQAA